MAKKLYSTFAAIHLGSEFLSIQIVEYYGTDRYKVLEQCSRRIRLGEETFKNKLISFPLVNEICDILQGFKQLMDEYDVDEYKMQASMSVREARNQLVLLDQIHSRTGLDVEVVDMPQEIYTKYVAIRNTLREGRIVSNRDALLMIDSSPGGLGVTYVQDEQIKYQENFHVGVIRIKESIERNKRDNLHFNTALTEFISSTIGPVHRELQNEDVKYLVLSGAETQLVLKMMDLDTNKKVHRIPAADFDAFFQQMRKLNLAQIMKVYNIPEDVAELVLPTVLLYEQLLDLVPAEEVIVTADSFIDGMRLLHIIEKTAPEYRQKLDRELISLIHCIGRRYHYDRKHAQQVERLSLIIFDKVAKLYGMGERERLLLRATAILHDIGKYICMRSYSIYTHQLIMDTDIIGFSDYDRSVIALAAYYHDNNLFDQNDKTAPPIDSSMVAEVTKMAAIVRLADALDRSYLQKIRKCKVNITEKTLLITASSKKDLALEEWTFDSNADFFEEIYGLKAVLERVNA